MNYQRPFLAFLLAAAVLLASAWALATLSLDRVAQLYNGQAVPVYQAWLQLLQQSQRENDELQRLRMTNQFFNQRIRFVEDADLWGQADYWATPLETMARRAGDCEDFTIAKYFSLREIGIPAEKLRITYVKARIGGAGSSVTQAHMVLAYYPQPTAEPLILDNLVSSILPASQRADLTPVFSFNAEGLWMAGSAAPNSSADRLTRWRQLIEKMQKEGFL